MLLLIFFQQIHAQINHLNPVTLDKYYTQEIKNYKVPGLAVAIVHADSILLQSGYGNISKDSHRPVDKNTLFGIASLTKTFTAGLTAIAVSENKLSFDTSIKEILPDFKLYDPYVTSQVTIRDALSHRTGLGNFSGDLIWYGSSVSDSVIIRRLQHLEPDHGFRSGFGYSNIMYLVISKVLEETYQKPYINILDSLIVDPLQMKNTTCCFKEAMAHQNLAHPHIESNKETILQPYLSWDNMLPAGGLFSNAQDLSIYIQMLLNNGIHGDSRIIRNKYLEKLWGQQTPKKLSWLDKHFDTPVNFKSYGMGWALMDFNGHKVVHHSGGLDGMVSQLVLIPDKKIGAVFLANKTTALPTALMYDLLDRLLIKDTSHNYPEQTIALLNKIKKSDVNQSSVYSAPEAIDTSFYCGQYFDSLVGPAKIYKKNDSIILNVEQSNIFRGYLIQSEMLSFDLYWPNVPSLNKGKVNFEVNGLGEIKGFTINLPNPDLHFKELYFSKQH